MLLLNKITKLKAIHNVGWVEHLVGGGAFTEQNYKIESNSQLDFHVDFSPTRCFYWTKLQNWKQFTTHDSTDFASLMVLLLNKITKLKAIHNAFAFTISGVVGAFTEQNYKIESNSQPKTSPTCTHQWCFYWTKLQNWKQFTTLGNLCFSIASVLLLNKITKLKAIHNSLLWYECMVVGAFTEQNYKNWKQFTTARASEELAKMVLLLNKITKIESNSQPQPPCTY